MKLSFRMVILLAPLIGMTSGAMCITGVTTTPDPVLLPPDIPEQPTRTFVLNDADALKGFRVSRRTCLDDFGAIISPADGCHSRSTWISSEDVNVTIFFNADDMSVERATARIAFPDYLLFPESTSAWSSDFGAPEPTAVIESVTDNRIRGYVTGSVWNVIIWFERIDDPNCISDDILGQCAEYAQTNTPFRIEFDLAIDKLDCIGPDCE